jgi:hypothetical protein
MNTYEPETPRAALAMVAAALSTITLGVFVVVPAPLDYRFERHHALAAAQAAPAAAVEVSIVPARIDVYGAREPNVAWAVDNKAQPNCKPEV